MTRKKKKKNDDEQDDSAATPELLIGFAPGLLPMTLPSSSGQTRQGRLRFRVPDALHGERQSRGRTAAVSA